MQAAAAGVAPLALAAMEYHAVGAAATYSLGMSELNPNEDISKFEVYGTDMQIASICLQPHETVLSSAGSMTFTDPDIMPAVTCDNCWQRCVSGESCCATTWTNQGSSEKFIGLSANVPGKLIPLDLRKGNYRCKNGAFHSSLGDVTVSFDTDCCTATCCCGGQGCIRQTGPRLHPLSSPVPLLTTVHSAQGAERRRACIANRTPPPESQ